MLKRQAILESAPLRKYHLGIIYMSKSLKGAEKGASVFVRVLVRLYIHGNDKNIDYKLVKEHYLRTTVN